jgi:hypothetical protein
MPKKGISMRFALPGIKIQEEFAVPVIAHIVVNSPL